MSKYFAIFAPFCRIPSRFFTKVLIQNASREVVYITVGNLVLGMLMFAGAIRYPDSRCSVPVGIAFVSIASVAYQSGKLIKRDSKSRNV
jgi:hypothetical protein